MTHREHKATQWAKKYAKNWDYFIIAVEAYLDGYDYGQTDRANIGAKEISVEFENGEHQLSSASFEKWKQEQKPDNL